MVSGLPGDLRQRLTKVRLRMARIMPQRYEDLDVPQSARQHVVRAATVSGIDATRSAM